MSDVQQVLEETAAYPELTQLKAGWKTLLEAFMARGFNDDEAELLLRKWIEDFRRHRDI